MTSEGGAAGGGGAAGVASEGGCGRRASSGVVGTVSPAGVGEFGARSIGENVRLAVVGNVDSGKSTLVGCLTRDIADDGRGHARSFVFRHRHEQENGRTSSVGMELMGFDKEDRVVTLEGGGGAAGGKTGAVSRAKLWQAVHERSSRSLTLIDLCGHEKYLKTTIFGLTGMMPDYVLVVVGANMGLSKMTREHVGIASALRLPLLVVVTKVDLAPKEVFAHTLEQVTKTLRMASKLPFAVKTEAHVATAAAGVAAGRLAPVLCVSSVTGEGMDLLRALLRGLTPRVAARIADTGVRLDRHDKEEKEEGEEKGDGKGDGKGEGKGEGEEKEKGGEEKEKGGEQKEKGVEEKGGVDKVAAKEYRKEDAEVVLDSVFNVPGVGMVVAGTVLDGKVEVGDTVLLGPDKAGEFTPVTVRSIHVQYTPTEVAVPGGTASFAIRAKSKVGRDLKRPWIRRGMALIAPGKHPHAVWQFDAEVVILHHQTTLSPGYAPIMHVGVVAQTAKVLAIRDRDGKPMDALRTGDRAVVSCAFLYAPAYVHTGATILFREGRAKGVGKILAVSADRPDPEALHVPRKEAD